MSSSLLAQEMRTSQCSGGGGIEAVTVARLAVAGGGGGSVSTSMLQPLQPQITAV